ncbi:OmpP1/FadL family transporter [Roseibium aestuarii]|uniref:OmpP1/FadL family transporter n=1 Tax=Roseibium aestuarii TaxID=2600299 RepID=A0ABW4JYK3_9HYPH|nr:outer membrane protein transport protein [Roseibium aestuarii]
MGVSKMSWAFSKSVLMSASALAVIAAATSAHAGGFALREQSSYYQGMSFAGNGTTGPSISSIFWNPATITGAKDGLTSEAHNSFIIPKGEIKGSNTVPANAFGAGTPPVAVTTAVDSGDIASDAWIGSNYFGYKLSDQAYLGFALTAPFGLSTKPDDPNWAGAGYNRSSKVFSINANPIAGFKINEMFSVALGAQIQYIDIRLTNAGASPLSGVGTTSLAGDSTSVGWTAGVTFTPMQGTELGLGFRSAVAHDLSGSVVLPVATGGLPAGAYNISTKLITPEIVTLSAKQDVNDKLRVLGTFEWSNWSRLEQPKVLLTDLGNAQLTSLPFNYSDGYFLSLGAEYDFNDKLTLRAGAAYEWSPIDTNVRSARLPDNDRIWVSAGGSYNFNDSLSFDVGYTHIFGTDTELNIVPGHQDYSSTKGTLVGDVEASVDILSASMRYTW